MWLEQKVNGESRPDQTLCSQLKRSDEARSEDMQNWKLFKRGRKSEDMQNHELKRGKKVRETASEERSEKGGEPHNKSQ